MSCLSIPSFDPTTFPGTISTYINTLISSTDTYVNEQGYLISWCLGVNWEDNYTPLPDQTLFTTWAQGTCVNYLDGVPFDMSQQMMSYLLTRYYSTEPFTNNRYLIPTVENNMVNTCINYQGSCMAIETYMCASCSNEQISSSYGLLRYCGCFGTLPTGSPTSRECAMLCSNGVAIKLADTKGIPLECNEAICVIDNVSIQAADTIFNNSSISEVCTNCTSTLGATGCKCFIDVSLPNIAEQLGVSGNNNLFQTYCTDAQCFVISDSGQTTQVSCASFNQTLKEEFQIVIPTEIWWLLAIILVLGVIVIMSLYLWGQSFSIKAWKLWAPEYLTTHTSSTEYRKR